MVGSLVHCLQWLKPAGQLVTLHSPSLCLPLSVSLPLSVRYVECRPCVAFKLLAKRTTRICRIGRPPIAKNVNANHWGNQKWRRASASENCAKDFKPLLAMQFARVSQVANTVYPAATPPLQPNTRPSTFAVHCPICTVASDCSLLLAAPRSRLGSGTWVRPSH